MIVVFPNPGKDAGLLEYVPSDIYPRTGRKYSWLSELVGSGS